MKFIYLPLSLTVLVHYRFSKNFKFRGWSLFLQIRLHGPYFTKYLKNIKYTGLKPFLFYLINLITFIEFARHYFQILV